MHFLEKHGAVVTNVIASSKAGTSDLIACINGRYVALEIKGRGDTLKPMQAEKLKQVIRAGGIGMVVKSLDDAVRAFNLAIEGKPSPELDFDLKQFKL
jgi:hypothetical protein